MQWLPVRVACVLQLSQCGKAPSPSQPAQAPSHHGQLPLGHFHTLGGEKNKEDYMPWIAILYVKGCPDSTRYPMRLPGSASFVNLVPKSRS